MQREVSNLNSYSYQKMLIKTYQRASTKWRNAISYHRIHDGELNAIVREGAGSWLHGSNAYEKERLREIKRD